MLNRRGGTGGGEADRTAAGLRPALAEPEAADDCLLSSGLASSTAVATLRASSRASDGLTGRELDDEEGTAAWRSGDDGRLEETAASTGPCSPTSSSVVPS